MTTRTEVRLAAVAAETAMRGAATYFKSKGINVTDYGMASAILQRHTKARLPEALEDARQAIDANMGEVAEMTFRASMQLAGFDAAKEYAASMEGGEE